MKKRFIKIISGVLFAFLINFALLINVEAASASVSISSNYSRIVAGNNVTFTVRIQTDSPIGAWDYATSVSSNLTYVSGNAVSKSANLPSNSSTKVITYTFTYRAKTSGTATFTFKLANVLDYTTVSPMSFPSNTTKNITVITQAELEASYSKNNNLSSLSIDGYQLSPTFNKNTLEYNVELPNGVTTLKINGNKEDSTASITGLGERTVSEGKNKLEIKVTAQNGTVKTYIINATVKELDPIVVKVNNSDYNVIRKKEQISAPNSTFVETEIKINDLEVPAFKNEKLNYTLVGLKDADGNIALYIYNETNQSYTLYKEYNFKSSIIYIIENETKIPDGYTLSSLKIEDQTIKAYRRNDNSQFYLFCGINVETGEEHLYVYDSVEKTIQRYNDDEVINEYKDKETVYQYIIIGLGSLLIITYIILLITTITNTKKKKQSKMQKMSKKRHKKEISNNNDTSTNDEITDENEDI